MLCVAVITNRCVINYLSTGNKERSLFNSCLGIQRRYQEFSANSKCPIGRKRRIMKCRHNFIRGIRKTCMMDDT